MSAAAFGVALTGAQVYGFTNSEQLDSIIKEPTDWDDDADPNIKTLQQIVPPEFHQHLDVFKKSNRAKLPEGHYNHSMSMEGNSNLRLAQSIRYLKLS